MVERRFHDSLAVECREKKIKNKTKTLSLCSCKNYDIISNDYAKQELKLTYL